MSRLRRWLHLGLLAGGPLFTVAGWPVTSTPVHAEECTLCKCPVCDCHANKYAGRIYSAQSRSSVENAMQAQAAKGRVYEQTLWNNYFLKSDAELHSSGRAFLSRLAARSRGAPLNLYVQTCQDIPFTAKDLEAYARRRDDLNMQRARAAHDYLTIVLRQPPPQMYVYDPQRVGMWAYEAAPAYQIIKLTPQGVMDAASVAGIETAGAGLGSPTPLPNNAIGASAIEPVDNSPPPEDMSFSDPGPVVDDPGAAGDFGGIDDLGM